MKLENGANGASSFADVALTARVRGALRGDPRIGRCAIEVRADNGTVILSGEVPAAETALRVQQIALTVTGVDLVWTNLYWRDAGHARQRPALTR